MVAKLSEGLFPSVHLRYWSTRTLSHSGSLTQNNELRWGASLLNTCYVLNIFIQSHLIMIKALQGWHDQLSSCFADEHIWEVWWVESDRARVWALSTELRCLYFLFSTVLWVMSQGHREEEGCSGGLPGEGGEWSQESRATEVTLMGAQEWLMARVYVLG